MSEASMTLRGADKYGKNEDSLIGKGYEPYFLEQIIPALPYLEQKHIKVCINAGGSDPEGKPNAVSNPLQMSAPVYYRPKYSDLRNI